MNPFCSSFPNHFRDQFDLFRRLSDCLLCCRIESRLFRDESIDSFLLIRGIKTLAVRLDRHVENAEKAAKYLSEHKAVKKVYYPGLPDAQGYEINKRQAKNGGAMISFELYENYDIKRFFKALKLVQLAESLGGVESLVCHPATMTHAAIPYEVRQKIGITDGLIRLSIGIENIDDILADIEQAIAESEE